ITDWQLFPIEHLPGPQHITFNAVANRDIVKITPLEIRFEKFAIGSREFEIHSFAGGYGFFDVRVPIRRSERLPGRATRGGESDVRMVHGGACIIEQPFYLSHIGYEVATSSFTNDQTIGEEAMQ